MKDYKKWILKGYERNNTNTKYNIYYKFTKCYLLLKFDWEVPNLFKKYKKDWWYSIERFRLDNNCNNWIRDWNDWTYTLYPKKAWIPFLLKTLEIW